ncbi:MAG: hypothetical protein ABI068_03675 [Ktedonobacterales bacterium]
MTQSLDVEAVTLEWGREAITADVASKQCNKSNATKVMQQKQCNKSNATIE